MADQKIEMPRGDTRIITATLLDSDGYALDLTNKDTIYLSIKEEKTSTTYVVKNKVGSVEGNPLDGIASFKTDPVDTQEKNVGNWWYDIQVKFNDGTVYTPIIDNFEILAEISRPTYTITASSGSNGSISPTGAVSVESRADQVFTMVPDSNYVVDVLTVDGEDKTGDLVDNVYTFSTVIADHTISVTFKVG